MSENISEKSFITRASNLLGNAKATLLWGDEETTESPLGANEEDTEFDPSRVQYLSQQFVEQLCSNDGATEPLLNEVQRVIFLSHPQETRGGATNFQELLDQRAARGREERRRSEEMIAQVGEELRLLRDKIDSISSLIAQIKRLTEQRDKDETARKALLTKSKDIHAQDFEKVRQAVANLKAKIENLDKKKTQLELLDDKATNLRDHSFPRHLEKLKAEHPDIEWSDDEWANFSISFQGDTQVTILDSKKAIEVQKRQMLVDPVTIDASGNQPSEQSLLPPETALETLSLSLLLAEENRLQKLIGIDEEKQKKHHELAEKIRRSDASILSSKAKLKDAENARSQISQKVQLRSEYYSRVFEGCCQTKLATFRLQGIWTINTGV